MLDAIQSCRLWRKIREIFIKFPKNGFIVSIGDTHLSWRNSPVPTQTLNYNLLFCQDIISDSVSVCTDQLRFALCSSKVKARLDTPAQSDHYNQAGNRHIQKDAANQCSRRRRTHALIGLTVLKKMSSARSRS